MASASMPSATALGAPTGTIPRRDSDALIRSIQSTQFLNRQLISICQVNGLRTSGVKAELQRRIVDYIQSAINTNDTFRFEAIKASVERARNVRNGAATQPQYSNSPQYQYPPAYTYTPSGYPTAASAQTFNPASSSPANGYRPAPGSSNDAMSIAFSSSPFYTIVAPIGPPRTLEAISANRMTRTIHIRMSDIPALRKWEQDKSYRVMIFCAADKIGVQNIQFPHQSELKVNGDEVKANLRGLKNKPGTTRPADITDKLHLRSANYQNRVEFTWALTTRMFHLQAAVCKSTSVETLVKQIKSGRRFPKESVIADFNRKAADPDIEATSFVLSLKCPLSYMRLDTPCRGQGCKHVQCFDATSYLQLQEQSPQWLCPICNNEAKYESLAVDEYVKDILDKTSDSLESVTIEPNGRWAVPGQQANGSQSNTTNGHSLHDNDSHFDDDDDDLVILSSGGGRLNSGTPAFRPSASRTDSTPTSAPRGAASTSNKRPAPEVIDLLSDSDDDVPVRPVKRQATTSNYLGSGSPF